MVVDWTFRVSDFVSLLGFVISAVSIILLMKSDIRAVGLRLGFLEENVKGLTQKIDQLSQILNLMGKFEERMGALRRDVEDLRRGRGFITPSSTEG